MELETTELITKLPPEKLAWMLQKIIADIDRIHPGFDRGVHLRNGEQAAWTHMEGVFPSFASLRRTWPAPGGRFINDVDVQNRRRVVFLGGEIATELFCY
jgi:putative ABC transport system permease protein